jgi:hypothetical protein
MALNNEPAGIFRNSRNNRRSGNGTPIATVEARGNQDPTAVLFQLMTKAGFIYEKGFYR